MITFSMAGDTWSLSSSPLQFGATCDRFRHGTSFSTRSHHVNEGRQRQRLSSWMNRGMLCSQLGFGLVAARRYRHRPKTKCSRQQPSEGAGKLRVPCLYFGFSLKQQGGGHAVCEHVAVVEMTDGTRLLLLDTSLPQNIDDVDRSSFGHGIVEPECLSYTFTWNSIDEPSQRTAVVRLKDGSKIVFSDTGSFAQSIYTPHEQGPLLDEYLDAFAALALLAEAGTRPGVRRFGIAGLGAGVGARQLLALLPQRRLLAWDRSEAVIRAAAVCGGLPLRGGQLEVRCADLLDVSEAGSCEPLEALFVDLFENAGEKGEGGLPENLESTETWLSLLGWVADGRGMSCRRWLAHGKSRCS
eukprot:TRINITY_DN36505_c0_g1_i1.p1 TRINITY_DN36505_c0_g1~~TRINITY_DN36505_c0_g1_i1.p1  ORF type:complete len:355 (-),score=43.88 TRINITY_DN36505_c0_g1_i1:206-1270(-)